jgi:dTDP-4-amino-4,6-dideoxygalactose transaminase
MRVPFVDLHAQYLGMKQEIDDAIASVIRESGFIRGRFVTAFEEQFAAAVGVRHCVSCANGTDALYILMRGLGIRPGDEVITTAHSWISTSETITQAGGRVVFCDTDAETFTIDPATIESKVTPRTVGIIPVHLYGQPADMDPILELSKRRNLWVIEDCAQAHMAEYKGRKVGTMGDAASFSFYPGKNLGAMGDAGALVTNDARLAEWCELYARHGGKGEHKIEGINSRLDGIQAAVLSAKLPYLPGWNKARQRIAASYDRYLGSASAVRIPKVGVGRTHVYHLYVLRLEERDAVQQYLGQRGIATMLNYSRALPFYPAYARLGHGPGDFANAFLNQSRILSIPMYPEMTEEMVSYVATSVLEGAGACG